MASKALSTSRSASVSIDPELELTTMVLGIGIAQQRCSRSADVRVPRRRRSEPRDNRSNVLCCCFLVQYPAPCCRRGLSFLVSTIAPPVCLGFLLPGVLNSSSVDSWRLWLFLCDARNCCLLVARLLRSGVLDPSFPTSWIAPSWCPGLLATGRGRQSVAVPPNRQKAELLPTGRPPHRCSAPLPESNSGGVNCSLFSHIFVFFS